MIGSPPVTPKTNDDTNWRSAIATRATPIASPAPTRRAPWPNSSANNVRTRGAECEADADFVRPLADDVGDQAVEANHREHHRDAGETGHQHRLQTRARQHAIDVLFEAADAGDGLRGIDFVNGPPDRGRVRERIAYRSRTTRLVM